MSLQQFILAHYPEAESVVNEITGKFQPFTASKGELLLEAGKISKRYYFLESGMVRAFAFDTEGNEVTTNLYASPTVVFEVASFFTQAPSQESLQTVTDCSGSQISFEELNQLFHALPQFREFGRLLLVKGFAALKQRTLSFITMTAEQRYANLISSSPGVFQHVPLKHIASYLGVTDTSLSRIRKEYSTK